MAGGLGKEKSGGLLSSLQSDGGESLASQASLEPQTLQQCLDELDSLVGLAEVKVQVKRLLAMQQANAVRAEAGLPTVPQTLHLVFTGDPGTGKTTVARIIGQLYKSAQLLPNGKLHETDRSGLVAGYVGQTALKVTDKLNEAAGGVLYIDEAYSLFSGGSQDFGDEAVAALVKGMEDRRNSLAVIVSGYKQEMNRFIESNPGLRSRFQTYIEFPNYTPDELFQIFVNMAQSHHIGMSDEVAVRLTKHFESVDTGGSRGNARYVRNIFESMYAQMSLVAAEDGRIEQSELARFELSHLPALQGETEPNFGFA